MNRYLSWVMVRCWNKRQEQYRQGHAALIILVLVCFLGTAGLLVARLVLGEAGKAKEAITRQQVVYLTQDVLQSALTRELRREGLESESWPVVLQPGQEEVQVQVSLDGTDKLGLRLLQVAARPAKSPAYVLHQLRWSFTRAVRQQAATYALIAAGSLQGDADKLGKILYTSENGAVFPDYAVSDFKNWRPQPCYTPVDLRTYGLGKQLYLYDSPEPYRIKAGTCVQGEGILVFGGDLLLEDGVTFPGRVVIFTESDLTTGANVTLQNALVFCKGRLSLGSNNKIRGAIFVKKEAAWNDDLILQHVPEVTAPFSTLASQQ